MKTKNRRLLTRLLTLGLTFGLASTAQAEGASEPHRSPLKYSDEKGAHCDEGTYQKGAWCYSALPESPEPADQGDLNEPPTTPPLSDESEMDNPPLPPPPEEELLKTFNEEEETADEPPAQPDPSPVDAKAKVQPTPPTPTSNEKVGATSPHSDNEKGQPIALIFIALILTGILVVLILFYRAYREKMEREMKRELANAVRLESKLGEIVEGKVHGLVTNMTDVIQGRTADRDRLGNLEGYVSSLHQMLVNLLPTPEPARPEEDKVEEREEEEDIGGQKTLVADPPPPNNTDSTSESTEGE